jgi:hypothetical protein
MRRWQTVRQYTRRGTPFRHRALAISAPAGEIEYPQIIQTRYEAADQKTGGQLVIWSERKKIFYGLDARISPSARYVVITQVTPTAGSNTLTYIEARTMASETSDYLYLTGSLKFRVSGMIIKSSNIPTGTSMPPKTP